MGTPAYMSPEQAMGRQELINQHSDQYSLGAILYEILTGRPPFTAESPRALMHRLVAEPFIPVRDLEPAAPAELAALAERALSKEPGARFPSTLELADAVTAYLSGEKVASYSYSTKELLVRFLRKHRAALAGGFTAILALLVAVAFMTWAYRREAKARTDALAAGHQEARAREAAQRAQQTAEHERTKTAEALEDSRRGQRSAHYSLAQALLDRAQRRFVSHRFSDALVLAAAARFHNPAQRGSPWYHKSFAADRPEAGELLARTDGMALLANAATMVRLTHRLTKPQPQTFWNQNFGTRSPLRIALSVDQDLVVLPTATTAVALYSLRAGATVRTLRGHFTPPIHQAFSSDGRKLITIERSGAARLWASSDGRLLRTFSAGGGRSALVLPDPSGGFLWANTEGAVFHIDALRETPRKVIPGSHGKFASLCMAPDGRLLLYLTNQGDLIAFSWPDGAQRHRVELGRKDFYRCAFSASGGEVDVVEYLASRISSWAFHKDTGRFVLKTRQTITPDLPVEMVRTPWGNRLVATNGGDFLIRARSTGRLLQRVGGHSTVLSDLRAVGRGTLLTLDARGELFQWAFSQGLIQRGTTHGSHVQGVVLRPGGGAYVSFGWDRTLRSFDEVRNVTRDLSSFGSIVWSADWSPDGRQIAAAANDGSVRLFDGKTFDMVLTLPRLEGMFPTVVFSPDSKRLFVISRPHLYAFAVDDGRLIYRVPVGTTSINGSATAPSRTHVVAWSEKGVQRIEFASGSSEIIDLKPPAGVVFNSCGALRGDVIYCQDLQNTLHVHAARSLKLLARLRGHRNFIASVRLSPDGKMLLTSADDSTLRVWDLATGRPLIIFSDKGTQFFQVSEDGRNIYFAEDWQVIRIPFDLALRKVDPGVLLERVQGITGQCLDGIATRPVSSCDNRAAATPR